MLADAHLRVHSLQSKALDVQFVRELTPWLLFHQHTGGAPWRRTIAQAPVGRGAPWLVAVLSMLIVEEGLVLDKERVLGFDLQALHIVVAALVRDERVKRSEVFEVLATMPNGGRTLDVVRNGRSIADLPQGPRGGISSGGSGATGPMILASAGAVSVPAARLILAARFVSARAWLVGITVAWFVIAHFMERWQWFGLESLFIASWMLSTGAVALLLASCFPRTEDVTPAAHAFVFSSSACCIACGTFAAFNSYVYRDEPDVNDACRWVHLLLVLSLWTLHFTHAIATFMRRATWSTFRRVIACDGLLHILSTLSYRALGPPAVYPPHNITFGWSICRSLWMFALALVLTPTMRARAAELANQAGLNHVELDLKELSGSTTSLEEALRRASPSKVNGAADRADADRAPRSSSSNGRASGSRKPWQVAIRELLLRDMLRD